MSILIKNQDMPKEGEKYLLEIRHDGTVYDAIGQRVAAQAVQFESPWRRVEDGLPKKGTYLIAVRWAKDNHFSYEIAHFTDKLEDVFPFEYEAVSGPGWYIWSDYNDDNAQISPDYWMPIEPPKEDA